jgi:hypothetical protein
MSSDGRSVRMSGVVAAGLLGLVVLPGLAREPEPGAGDDVRRQRAIERLKDNRPAMQREADAPRDLPGIDPALVDWYRTTVTELSDPAYEGRAPGSEGIRRAAELIESRFKELGFEPAFASSELAADGTEVITPRSDWRQPFGVGERTNLESSSMSVDGEALEHGVDYSVLAYSGSGDVEAPVAFAGYAIVSGPGGFMGFDPNTRFEGKVALCLKYEPMDGEGHSLWDSDGFSHHAQMTHKASALIRRGAAAVLIVAPPGANDERAEILESVESTRLGRPGLGGKAPKFDAPVVQITPEVARRLLDGVGEADLTLESLIDAANAGAVYRELGERAVSLSVTMETSETVAFNVGGVLPGRGDLADEFVVIGSHYDHVGYGGVGSFPGNEGLLHPGADDNASGTTGMLLTAGLVRDRLNALPPDQAYRSVLFLAFSAEEMGLLGSLHYTKEPIVAMERHTLMLNLDMIGRLESDLLELGGLDSSPMLEDMADPLIERSGLAVARDTSVGNGRSDHASFDAVGVPNMFFFTGLHPQYHRPEDTADLIDSEGAVRVALLCTDIAIAGATRAEPLPHTRDRAEIARQEQPPKVRLGILPTNSTKGGVLIRRVFPDTSASDAGLQPDDRIYKWNGEDLKNTEDLRPKLVEHEPGETVTLTVERGDEVIEVEMVLRGIE